MIRKEEVVSIGQFAKPHGVKGEISLVTTFDGLFEDMDDPYIVCDIDSILVPFFVDSWRPKSASVMLVKLYNVNDEEAARTFSNRTVYYPVSALPENGDDMVTWAVFVGYELVDEHYGRIGVVKDVDDSTINVLLHVDCGEKDLLIPLAEELVRSVDKASRQLTVALPEGILEL